MPLLFFLPMIIASSYFMPQPQLSQVTDKEEA